MARTSALMKPKPVLWKGAGLARIDGTLHDWYHVTAADNLPGIERSGLLLKPPSRLYDAAAGDARTLGGIYVTSDYADVLPFVCTDNMRKRMKARKLELPFTVAVLKLEIPAGTRFCLDEDDVTRLWYRYKTTSPTVFGPSTEAILKDALQSTRGTPSPSVLGAWSCRLAHHLDQKWIRSFALRLIDPPKIVRVELHPCHERYIPGMVHD